MLQGGKIPVEILTALISRLSSAGIPIGLKLPGPLAKPPPVKSRQVIPGPHGSKSAPLSLDSVLCIDESNFEKCLIFVGVIIPFGV